MPSFSSLYAVRSGLFAQRRALETVGQNVANASTAGYTRQEISLAAAEPNHVIHSAGRGVNDVRVVRYRDEFLDRQFRSRNGAVGYNDTYHAQLSELEGILGDLSEGGLRTALDDHFNAWDTLALRPSDTSGRIQVISSAKEFISQAQGVFQQLTQQRTTINDAIRGGVQEVNLAAQQIADLNKVLMGADANQQQSNELLDRRDMLLDSLSKLAGVSVSRHDDGSVSVHAGSLPLVDKGFAYPIDATLAQEGDMDPSAGIQSTRQFVWSLAWNGTTNPLKLAGGDLGALVDLRDKAIPDYMNYLDSLVRSVTAEVNARHTGGVLPPVTPVDIFDIGADWMAIGVNAALESDPTLIMAGAGSGAPGLFAVAPGDGTRAQSIAAIRDAAILTGGPVGSRTVTPSEYLRSVHSMAGLQVQQAQRRSDASALQVAQAEKHRQSVSGVSLDDEMTKMIQYQQAYNAAARVMTSIDEMLDVIVNRLGTFGR